MSAIQLAEALDDLHARGLAFISEAERVATVSNLSMDDALDVARRCDVLGWAYSIYDGEQTAWATDDLTPAFAPFRLVMTKPGADGEALMVLSNVGFSRWLKDGHVATKWKVARLVGSIETKSRLLSAWGVESEFTAVDALKSPRLFVKESGEARVVPMDIRPWLWRSWDADFDNSAFRVWANAATRMLLFSLADEVSQDGPSLKFRGPPRLSLQIPGEGDDAAQALGLSGFVTLQDAASWVFESDRDAEARHIFFATELARSAPNDDGLFAFFRANAEHALDGAKIAYQMSLADISKETIKALADLRKAVTDETAKLSDITRQLIAALASALAVGFGLIAARITTTTPPALMLAVLGVVVAYVAVVAVSGRDFIKIQGDLRRDWQARVYRFLPANDYTKMVSTPVSKAEASFYLAVKVGGVAMGLLVIAFLLVSFHFP